MPLVQNYPRVLYRCKYIVDKIDEPWSDPTLQIIFNGGKRAPTTIPDEQLNKGKLPSLSLSYYIFFL